MRNELGQQVSRERSGTIEGRTVDEEEDERDSSRELEDVVVLCMREKCDEVSRER